MITIKRTSQFDAWFSGIKDGLTKRRLIARLRKVQLGNFGDVKVLEKGICEMREHFGPGWRMYYVQCSEQLIVMLGGGEKSSQSADIAKALKTASKIEDL